MECHDYTHRSLIHLHPHIHVAHLSSTSSVDSLSQDLLHASFSKLLSLSSYNINTCFVHPNTWSSVVAFPQSLHSNISNYFSPQKSCCLNSPSFQPSSSLPHVLHISNTAPTLPFLPLLKLSSSEYPLCVRHFCFAVGHFGLLLFIICMLPFGKIIGKHDQYSQMQSAPPIHHHWHKYCSCSVLCQVMDFVLFPAFTAFTLTPEINCPIIQLRNKHAKVSCTRVSFCT